jgi:hypothetical protein
MQSDLGRKLERPMASMWHEPARLPAGYTIAVDAEMGSRITNMHLLGSGADDTRTATAPNASHGRTWRRWARTPAAVVYPTGDRLRMRVFFAFR